MLRGLHACALEGLEELSSEGQARYIVVLHMTVTRALFIQYLPEVTCLSFAKPGRALPAISSTICVSNNSIGY